MNKKWKKLSLREKYAAILDFLILLAMPSLYFLKFKGILDYSASTFAWALFPFHFFITALGKWKVDRDFALQQLMLGGFVSIFSLLGLASFFVAYF